MQELLQNIDGLKEDKIDHPESRPHNADMNQQNQEHRAFRMVYIRMCLLFFKSGPSEDQV